MHPLVRKHALSYNVENIHKGEGKEGGKHCKIVRYIVNFFLQMDALSKHFQRLMKKRKKIKKLCENGKIIYFNHGGLMLR